MIKEYENKNCRCAIALGSNLGDSLKTLKKAVQILAETENINLISQSSWYQTKAVGPPQPDYVNGCIVIKTNSPPEVLLTTLLNVEQEFGRVRKEKWGPRTLDLDLILYEDLILKTPNLKIPHPRMRERGFVLVPLAEITPNWVDPVTKLTIIELKKKINCDNIYLIK